MARARAHAHLLATAGRLAPGLERQIARTGPLWFPRRRTTNLALYLCRFVVGQQLSGAAARTIWARLEVALRCRGPELPERCRPAAVAQIRSSGVSGAKARALLSIREAGRGGLLEEALAATDRAARDALLQEIRGVGQWTCDMVSIFFCKDPDVWPLGDASVQRAFRIFVGERAGDDRHEHFAPWRSILTMHLYRYLDDPVAAEP
jgi:3-methyladenine DNA glycosylase/8-oxoguanine DNA glycosylase